MLQYLLLITWPKASDYLYDKEEIDVNSNLVTESKVAECNRMSLTFFTQKSISQALQKEYGQDYTRRLIQRTLQRCLKCVQARKRHMHYLKQMIVTS